MLTSLTITWFEIPAILSVSERSNALFIVALANLALVQQQQKKDVVEEQAIIMRQRTAGILGENELDAGLLF